MTNQEAITILKEIEYPVNGDNKEYRNMAFEMAIKALEQNPTDRIEYGTDGNTYKLWISNGKEYEPSGDLISRKKVLNQIFYSTDNSGDVVLGSALRHRIEMLPSVNPQPKYEDIAKAFQVGLAFGFGEKYDEMDRVIDEIKETRK